MTRRPNEQTRIRAARATAKTGVGPRAIRITATAFAAWNEWYTVYRASNWGYTASTPMLFGIGPSPLLKRLILPPAMMVANRMLMPA